MRGKVFFSDAHSFPMAWHCIALHGWARRSSPRQGFFTLDFAYSHEYSLARIGTAMSTHTNIDMIPFIDEIPIIDYKEIVSDKTGLI